MSDLITLTSVSTFSRACSVSLGSSVVITGGYPGKTRVSSYLETGWVLDLPYLNIGRFAHGCSFYQNEDGTKVEL